MGKAHYMVKDLTEVRNPQRKLMPDNAGSGQHEQTSLWGIAETVLAEASTPEEPDAGKPHVRDCLGGTG